MPEHLSTRKVLPRFFILLGVIILFGSIGVGLYNYALTNPGNAPLPDSLSGLSLKSYSFGNTAVEEINKLHGLTFPLSSGAVGVYGAENQAILWISGSRSRFSAKKLLLEMADRIAEGNSPFIPINEFMDTNRTIYELDGHGQIHYYFQSKKLLVWLAVDYALAETTLAEVLKFYP